MKKNGFEKMKMVDINMVKKNSPRVVRIFAEKSDPFFSTVEVSNSRTGKIQWSYILSSDVPQRIGILEREGFIITSK